jgi:signal transduction histidine kinase
MKQNKFFIYVLVFLNISFSFSQSVNKSLDFYISKATEFITKDNIDSVSFYVNKVEGIKKNKETYKRYILFLSRLGHYYEGSGAFERSIQKYQNGLKIAETFNDDIFKSKMFADISQTYRIFHDYKKAIIYGKKSFKVIISNSKESLIQKTYALDVIGAAYNEFRKPDSALYYHEKILTYIPQLDSSLVKATIVNIGYTYMNLNRLEESRIYTEKGLNLYKPTKDPYAIGSIYTNLGMYGRRAKKYDYALRMFDSAIFYSNKSKYIETFVWIYDERAQVYKAKNNIKKALEDTESLLKIKDSIFRKQRDITAQETEAKYETAKKANEIALQKEQLLEQKLAIKNRNLYAIVISSAFLILGIIFFSIYKRNQLRRKQLQKEIDLKDALSKIKTQNRLQEQRLRISRDLHDNIGSQLTFIISSIDNLKYVSKDANEKLKDKLSSISSFTGTTIHELRDTIWAMNKNEISIEDLHTRVLSFIEKAKIATEKIEFDVNYTTAKNKSFSSLEGMNIFRVIQEAINNAIKYANASSINIELKNDSENFIVLIQDDGIGFDIRTIKNGNGLSNMEARISEIEGKIKITSKKNIGTIIQIICKL